MKSRNGQSVVEYAVLIAVVIAGLLVIQIYMRRGVQGKLREGADQVGEQFTPHTATYGLTRTYDSTRADTTTAAGQIDNNWTQDKRGRTGTDSPAQHGLGASKLWDTTD